VVVGRDTTLSWGVLTDYIVYSGDQYGDDDEEDRDDEEDIDDENDREDNEGDRDDEDDREDEEGDREDKEIDKMMKMIEKNPTHQVSNISTPNRR